MDLSRMTELKRKLVNDKELIKVWEFFLDHFAENLAFLDLGGPVQHGQLEMTIAHSAQEMFPKDAAAVAIRLVHLPEQQFIHGAVNVSGRVGGVFYFEDIHVGLVAVSDHFPSDETKFVRFSIQPYKPGGKPSRN